MISSPSAKKGAVLHIDKVSALAKALAETRNAEPSLDPVMVLPSDFAKAATLLSALGDFGWELVPRDTGFADCCTRRDP